MQTEEQIRNQAIREVAQKMMIAARTAPKGRGNDNMQIMLLDEEDIKPVAAKMRSLVEKESWPHSFARDAGNIEKAPWMILLASRIDPMRLNVCGMCGFPDCDEKDKHPEIPCVFNTGDLGIAIGSAVSVAMDHRVDNRIMYTVGQAVKRMGLFPEEYTIIYAIPLSVSSKNVFFDRK